MEHNSEKLIIEEAVRDDIPDEFLELLEESDQVLISGQPLHFVPLDADQDPISFDQCDVVEDEPVSVKRIYRQRIPLIGHRHLAPQFIADEGYPAVLCITGDGDELIMGMRSSLLFSIRRDMNR
ncbi:MAG: hypothetical protein NTV95_01940 [Candidatus Saccharibacteria bacterium]|nr:hypothetical protein [Candidatus Saccharibacteria bacterium]